MQALIHEIVSELAAGRVIPYLGPELLRLSPSCSVPADPMRLATFMTAKVSVPHKIRQRLTQAAQFIENFKHRKSVVALMTEAFAKTPEPSPLQLALATSGAGLWVDCWYDNAFAAALKSARPQGDWVQLQGLAQSEHFGTWIGGYDAEGKRLADLPAKASADHPILYQPIGAHGPAGNFLVSDSDYVEVLTEIDIQTPIPQAVQDWRAGRSFLFIGCRFDDQLTRSFARQIMKRSSDRHWAVLPHEPTRMEARFLAEQGITRIAEPLDVFAAALTQALQSSQPAVPA